MTRENVYCVWLSMQHITHHSLCLSPLTVVTTQATANLQGKGPKQQALPQAREPFEVRKSVDKVQSVVRSRDRDDLLTLMLHSPHSLLPELLFSCINTHTHPAHTHLQTHKHTSLSHTQTHTHPTHTQLSALLLPDLAADLAQVGGSNAPDETAAACEPSNNAAVVQDQIRSSAGEPGSNAMLQDGTTPSAAAPMAAETTAPVDAQSAAETADLDAQTADGAAQTATAAENEAAAADLPSTTSLQAPTSPSNCPSNPPTEKQPQQALSLANCPPHLLTDEQLRRVLHCVFGHTHFRGRQLEVVRAVLAQQVLLAVLPTGAGKSLCYQLPAVLLPGQCFKNEKWAVCSVV